jgi:hypothetical protein
MTASFSVILQALHFERDRDRVPHARGLIQIDEQPALQPHAELVALEEDLLHAGGDVEGVFRVRSI